LYDLYYVQGFVFGRDRLWKRANEDGGNLTQRQVMEWLRKQETYQLFKKPKREKIVRSTVVRGPSRIMGIDLADLQLIAYDGYNYLLTAIDLFSKKAYARALKTKTKEEVVKAMRSIFKESGHKGSVRSDRGSEFINPLFGKLLEEFDISQVLSLAAKPQSNGQVERFNSIIKRLIRISMIAQETRDWPSMLQKLVSNYNQAIHETLKMSPNDAHKLHGNEREDIVDRIKERATALSRPPSLKVGDQVRIAKLAVNNDGKQWTKDIYTVREVRRPRETFASVVYRLKTPDVLPPKGKRKKRNIWEGDFYEENLQKIENVENEREGSDRYYDIKRLVRRASSKGIRGYIVLWVGGEHTWEPETSLLEQVPKLVKSFRG